MRCIRQSIRHISLQLFPPLSGFIFSFSFSQSQNWQYSIQKNTYTVYIHGHNDYSNDRYDLTVHPFGTGTAAGKTDITKD